MTGERIKLASELIVMERFCGATLPGKIHTKIAVGDVVIWIDDQRLFHKRLGVFPIAHLANRD